MSPRPEASEKAEPAVAVQLQVLHLENDPADAELVRDTLASEGISCEVRQVETEAGFMAALHHDGLNLILADYTLPTFDGLSALRIARQEKPELPFIFVSGTLGEEVAIDALKIGASDYVHKSRLSRLVPSVQRALREANERTERKRAEDAAQRSQSELRDLVENVPAIFIASPAAANVFVSRGWREYTGLSSLETTGSGWQCVIHPDDRERHIAKWQICSAKGEPFEDEARIRGEEGGYRWFLIRATAARDESGNILRWYGVLTDIEDRKRTELALHLSEYYLSKAQTLARLGSWGVNILTRQILHASEELLRLYGLHRSKGPPAMDDFYRRIHPEDKRALVARIDRAAQDKADFDAEFRVLLADGSIGYHLCGGHPSPSGVPGEYIGFTMDVTERKRADQEREKLRRLEADLAHMNRLSIMGELVASLAHEITQPIASARNNARAALNFLDREPPGLDTVREALACVVDDADRAGKIIDRIRDHVRKAPPRKEHFDLNQAIDEVIVLGRGAIAKNGVVVETRLAGGLSPVLGDRVQLQQVVLNLVLNAVEAMSSVDAGPRELLISTEPTQGQGVAVTVRDSGPGIDPEHVDRVFEAFYTTKTGGVGMGLAICRSIIDDHGGRLWADSNGPRGAVFQFTLPGTDNELRNGVLGHTHPSLKPNAATKTLIKDSAVEPECS